MTNIQNMKLRIFDVSSGCEETSQWDKEALEAFTRTLLSTSPRDGEIVHCCVYRRIHRIIRNYDRNEVHVYWEHVVGYDPVKEWMLSQSVTCQRKGVLQLLSDAFAFVLDPEARRLSSFMYSSGNPMSVRAARQHGLMS